jgi:adenosylcobinamide-GDP ribazoletransferase
MLTMASKGWMRSLAADVRVSILFCTRLPIPNLAAIDSHNVARASWAFPVAGALVGGAGALVYVVALGGHLPPMVAAVLALATTLVITGCLHEDGLADAVDGFGGGRHRERKLEIMRDSLLGTYGVCALVMSLILRWSAISTLASPLPVTSALVAAHVSGRAALPALMYFVPPARADGLSAQAGQPPGRSVAVAVLLGILTLGVSLGPAATMIGLVLAASAWSFMAWLSMRQIGGQTGDVLGALEQIIEIIILLTTAAMWRTQP